jgi:hypothetical protein
MLDCNTNIPDLEFTISGNKVVIPGSDLMVKDDFSTYCFYSVATTNFGIDMNEVVTLDEELAASSAK